MKGTQELALAAIRISSSADFESGLAWGQWCRDLATAALENNEDSVREIVACNPCEFVRRAIE